MSNDPDTGADDGDEPRANPVTRGLRVVLPDFVRRRFALKFALVLVIMGVILAGLGFVATDALSKQVEDNTRAEYERLASQQASLVETWIERNVASIKLASQNQELNVEYTGTQSVYQLQAALRRPFGSLYGASTVYLVSTSRETTNVSGPAIIANPTNATQIDPLPVADTPRDWVSDLNLRNMSSGAVRMSDVYNVSGTPVVGFISRVEGPYRRFLVMEFEVRELAGSIRNEGLTTGGDIRQFTQVVGSDYTVQTDTRMVQENATSAVLSQYGNPETIRRALQTGNANGDRISGVRLIENDPTVMDEPYAVGYASVEVSDVDPQWAVVTHAPTSDLFGFVRTISQWGQIVTLLGAVLVGLVGATMGYSTASAIDRLRQRVAEMEEGNLEVGVHSGRIDSIGQLYDGFASMRDALREQISEAEQARKEAEVARAEAMEVNEYLQNKAEEYSEIMSQCAAGDLTKRMDVDGENEAMDQIATDFNEMIEELEKTTGQLKHFADEVEEAGEVVETSAESVRDASEQVADSIQRISDDAHDQQERLEELSAAIDEAIEQFEGVTAEADVDVESSIDELREVADAINDLVELTDGMMAESENVAGAAEEQAAELNSVSQQANDLTRYARPLKDVLDSFETEEEHEFYFPTGPGSPQGNDES